MTFKEAIKYLGIEDFGKRIFESSSHGELFHLLDYILIAQNISKIDDPLVPKSPWFREWFTSVVKQAENDWSRPESVFQHIPRILNDSLSEQGDKS